MEDCLYKMHKAGFAASLCVLTAAGAAAFTARNALSNREGFEESETTLNEPSILSVEHKKDSHHLAAFPEPSHARDNASELARFMCTC